MGGKFGRSVARRNNDFAGSELKGVGLAANFDEWVDVGPTQWRPGLGSADAVGLGAVVRTPRDGCVTGQRNLRTGRVEIRYAMPSANALLFNDVFADEAARVVKEKESS